MVAVAAVLVVCVGALGAAGAQVRLQHAAAHAAREQGRSQQTEIVCVTLTEPAPAPFNALTLRASSCAPGRGE